MSSIKYKYIEDNYKESYELFKSLLINNVKRDGLDKLINWLDTSDAIEAPASTKYHLCCKGGLIRHSLNVYNRLKTFLRNEYGDACPYSEEQICIVSLLHDISKINMYELKFRNVKDEASGSWVKKFFYAAKQEDSRFFFGSHSETSLYMVGKFLQLSYDEELAILYHMGGLNYDEGDVTRNFYTAYRHSPLAYFLHLADYTASILDEASGED